MKDVLIAISVLGGLALIFGLGLTLANKVFMVKADPKKDAIREALPGANCGGCGYPGCDALSDAIYEGIAPITACPVGGNELVIKLADIMGVEATSTNVRLVATVRCQGTAELCNYKYDYKDIKDCSAAIMVNDGNKACQFGCMGLGSCENVCKFDAIHIDPNLKIAVVDPEKCTACGACVEACPKNIINLQPDNLKVKILCKAAEKGKLVKLNCKIGCIGCTLCAKRCKFEAITMVNNLPVFDYNKCVGCLMCAEDCPTGAIWGNFEERKIATIDRDACIGCGICKKVCKFDSIVGELKKPHFITEACTGCEECVKKCPTKCITMKDRLHPRDANAIVGTADEVAEFEEQ